MDTTQVYSICVVSDIYDTTCVEGEGILLLPSTTTDTVHMCESETFNGSDIKDAQTVVSGVAVAELTLSDRGE